MTRLLATARKATESKQWNNLYFVLTKNDTSSGAYSVHRRAGGTYSVLELGTNKYKIVKSNKLFQALTTFETSFDERELEIEVYINDVVDIKEFGDFFEMSNSGEKYKLEIYFNNQKYHATVTVDDKPFKVEKIEDLHGTVTQPTSTIKINLIMENPFFYSDYSYDTEIGAGITPLFKYPLPCRLNDNCDFIIGKSTEIIPHIVDNLGNENNGIIVTINTSKLLFNPTIYNDTTGFNMGFNLNVGVNSIIIINTIEKTVYVNDVYIANAKKLFDKWLTLEKGLNVIRFTALAGAETSKVKVQFYNKYRALS